MFFVANLVELKMRANSTKKSRLVFLYRFSLRFYNKQSTDVAKLMPRIYRGSKYRTSYFKSK